MVKATPVTLVSTIARQCSGFLEEAALGAEAGVGEGRVEAAEAVEGALDGGSLGGEVGDVTRHGEGVVRPQVGDELLEAVLATRGEGDAEAGVDGGSGGGRADATRRTGDQQDSGFGHAVSIGHGLAVLQADSRRSGPFAEGRRVAAGASARRLMPSSILRSMTKWIGSYSTCQTTKLRTRLPSLGS